MSQRSIMAWAFGIGAAFAAGSVAAQQQLEAPGTAWYGQGLAAGDGLIAIGTASSDLVDIYRRDAAGWQFDARVLAVDGNSFGYRVALGGGWLAVANRDTEVTGWPNFVDLFRRNGAGWQFQQRVAMPVALPFDDGYVHEMVVGADALFVSIRRYNPLGDVRDIRVFHWAYGGSAWGTPQQLLAPYAQRFFGAGLSLDGDRLAVADSQVSVAGGIGAVSVYRRISGSWIHAAALLSPQPAQLSFGNDVAICGERLAVLAMPRPGQAVANQVLLYAGQDIAWQAVGTPIYSPNPPANPNYALFGTELNCSREGLAMRSNLHNTVHALSLSGTPLLHQLTIGLPAYAAGEEIAVSGGDVLVADYMGPGGPTVDVRGLVFAFNTAIDSIFVHGFD